jgi:hypothetical protein
MHDQPQAQRGVVDDSSAERHAGDQDAPEEYGVQKWSSWIWSKTNHCAV